MDIENQKIEFRELIQSRKAASRLLKEVGVTNRQITFEESMVMRVAAYILTERDTFYGAQISEAMDLPLESIYPTLNRFVDKYGITTRPSESEHGARREHTPTKLGKLIFKIFEPQE